MAKIFVFLLSFLGIILLLNAVPPPTKCQASDSKCLMESARAFLPLLADGSVSPDLETLDPLQIKKIESSSKRIKFLARDVKVKGIRECSVEKITRDAVNSKLNINLLCSMIVDGQYELKGKIMALPLDGQGRLAVSFTNIVLKIDVHLGDSEKNGQKYWVVKHWDFDYTIQEKANVELSNLFKGNVKPTPEIQETLGAILTELISEITPPIVKAIVAEGMGTVKNYFQIVPSEDIAFD